MKVHYQFNIKTTTMANTLSPYMIDVLLDHYIHTRLPAAKSNDERKFIEWKIAVLKHQLPKFYN